MDNWARWKTFRVRDGAVTTETWSEFPVGSSTGSATYLAALQEITGSSDQRLLTELLPR